MTADTLDIAYLAIGARAGLSELDTATHSSLCDAHGGELGVIREVVDFAATLDELYHGEVAEDFPGVWAYEVAEPVGKAAVLAMAALPNHYLSAPNFRELARDAAGLK